MNEAERVLLILKDQGNPLAIAYFNESDKFPIKPDQIVKLFNDKLAGVGKIKPCPAFFLPSSLVLEIKELFQNKEFQSLEFWEKYFSMVSKSDFLTNNFTPSLAWLLKPENAFKVLSGQYDNKDQVKDKKPLGVNIEAQAMASKMFNDIISSGQHGILDYKKGLTKVERVALERFGFASEILNCSNSQVEPIKKRLTNAFNEALNEI